MKKERRLHSDKVPYGLLSASCQPCSVSLCISQDLVCEIQEEMGNPSPEISTSGPPSDHWRKSTSGHTRVQGTDDPDQGTVEIFSLG